MKQHTEKLIARNAYLCNAAHHGLDLPVLQVSPSVVVGPSQSSAGTSPLSVLPVVSPQGRQRILERPVDYTGINCKPMYNFNNDEFLERRLGGDNYNAMLLQTYQATRGIGQPAQRLLRKTNLQLLVRSTLRRFAKAGYRYRGKCTPIHLGNTNSE